MNILPKKFPWSAKKFWKTFPIFFSFRSGKFFKIALFWEKIVKISIFWRKTAKICKFRGKDWENYQNLHFFGKKFPPTLIFSTPLLLFGRIFTYESRCSIALKLNWSTFLFQTLRKIRSTILGQDKWHHPLLRPGPWTRPRLEIERLQM